MALIPITFKKDDANNVKKGSVRGQDLAFLYSIGMNKVAGILDAMGDNPCGQYGPVNVSGGYASFTLHAGYISIFGRAVYIEEGTTVEIPLPASSTQTNGVFGVRISLADIGSKECEFFYKFPDANGTIGLRKDDLLDNALTGVYEFKLYDFVATGTTLEFRNKTTEVIKNVKDYIDEFVKGSNFETLGKDDNSDKIATTAFVQSLIKDIAVPTGTTNAGSGYRTSFFRIGNFVVQWGNEYNELGAGDSRTIGIHDEYKNNVYSVSVTPVTDRNWEYSFIITSKSNTSFVVKNAGQRKGAFNWIAVGYSS